MDKAKKRQYDTAYNKANTVLLNIRLNKVKDADIIDLLSILNNKQGYIKELIRSDLRSRYGSELFRYFEEG